MKTAIFFTIALVLVFFIVLLGMFKESLENDA